MNILNENIKKLVDEKAEGKTSVFAKAIGVAPTTISDIYNNKTNAGAHVILKIGSTFKDVDMNWLIKGIESDFSQQMVEEPVVKYMTKQDLYNIHALVQKVHELDAIVRKLEKLLTR